jgi:hypothetical protein
MDRRGFLKAILAAAAAPAIVKAENLMKLYVPSREIIVNKFDGCGDYMPFDDSAYGWAEGDFTIETWMKPTAGDWHHIALVRDDYRYIEYLDGKEVVPGTLKARGFEIAQSKSGLLSAKIEDHTAQFYSSDFDGHVDDLRITSLARPKEHLGFKTGIPVFPFKV